MPVIVKNILPFDIQKKIEELDTELHEGDITMQGYCKKKWPLLEEYMPDNVVDDYNSLQDQLSGKCMDQKIFYKKLYELISRENINSSITTTIDADEITSKIISATFENANDSNVISRKRKSNYGTEKLNGVKVAKSNNSNRINKQGNCNICNQQLDQIQWVKHRYKNVVEEVTVLNYPRFLTVRNSFKNETSDALLQVKVTSFSVYDSDGHLCPFDSGLIEGNVNLYFSGYVTTMDDLNPSIKNSIAAKNMGPITEWWVSGLGSDEVSSLGFSTNLADYHLIEPEENYRDFMFNIQYKMALCNVIIEFLIENTWKQPDFSELLKHLEMSITDFTGEESLIEHSPFILDQIRTIDNLYLDNQQCLLESACMQSLMKLSGISPKERLVLRKLQTENLLSTRRLRSTWSKAATTSLVRNIFEDYFVHQIDTSQQTNINKQSKKEINENVPPKHNKKSTIPEDSIDKKEKIIQWKSKKFVKHVDRTYYDCVRVNSSLIRPGDCVILKNSNPNRSDEIVKVCYMWEEYSGSKMFHAHFFMRGTDTILGETSDPLELFFIDRCEAVPIGRIITKTIVKRISPFNTTSDNSRSTFYFHKRYDPNLARFEEPFPEGFGTFGYQPCFCCHRKCALNASQQPVLVQRISKTNCWEKLTWQNSEFTQGTGVYLTPNSFSFKYPKKPRDLATVFTKTTWDSETYPEAYRKSNDVIVGSNFETPQPFCVGIIKEIVCFRNTNENKINLDDVKLKVHKMYRPENTCLPASEIQRLDYNFLYWSDEVESVPLKDVQGKCVIKFHESLRELQQWASKENNRFYYNSMYKNKTKEFCDLSKSVINFTYELCDFKDVTEKISTPLRAFDVFAGCGGLSEGLHQAGVAKTEWAIEKEAPAAQAYRLNNPDATVFTEDCNVLLRLAVDGQFSTEKEQTIPKPGEVELLCGGPPCQGFSGINRFNASQYSNFKNSLIVSFLSYCDFYRPRFFIMENVRNFVTFRRGLVLKLTLRCLLAMGYQCTFGVLQAGCYGIPQTRRRVFILAAASSEYLPKFPEPTHVFSPRACQLTCAIDDKKYNSNIKWLSSAPFKTVTTRAAMFDLPVIRNGHKTLEVPYGTSATTHYQRKMRGDCTVLRDHICRDVPPLMEARIALIPTAPGSDWRTLPNIVLQLKDGSFTNKLIYSYKDKQGNVRGVCQCYEGKSCNPQDRQDNTLIPWCLPHTANRQYNWAGLYGRLDWEGFFQTTITNPEPLSKQGRTIHPTQNRVASVRECARSQGFPDSYRFFGNLMDKHRQIGNAVPPPLAKEIGLEILKCLDLKTFNS